MAETKVIMPQMGESIFEGTVTKWLKKKGDRVERDEPLFEISTDKVDSEIPAPASGVLQEILVEEGQTVQINTVVAVIGDGKAVEAPPAEQAKPAAAERVEKKAVAEPAKVEAGEPGDHRVRSSPLVRRIAREHRIDLSELAGKGTGTGGRITKRDILSHAEQRAEERPAVAERPVAAPAAPSGRVPMTTMRKAIAEHMVMSKHTSAHVTTVFEVDCSAIMKARERLRPDFERSGVKLTVTPFFIQAAINAIKKFPIVNSSVEGDTVIYKKDINIGMAVALDWGLIVPVIKNADEKNLQGLSRTVNEMGERARTKKLSPDDVKDGTFTITNPGNFGGLFGTPIINQPQVAIMGIGGIEKRPVVIDDAIAIRPMVYLALSFDHRVIDGAVADQFMAEVKSQLENWKI